MAKQPSKKESSPSKERETVFLNEDYPTLYSNHVFTSWTLLEIELIFGEIRESGDENIKVKNTIGVYLSPLYAKAVAAALSDAVKTYEKDFGELPALK
jgi:Protein of unknown function (DUF3467)